MKGWTFMSLLDYLAYEQVGNDQYPFVWGSTSIRASLMSHVLVLELHAGLIGEMILS